ncbi:MAG TPA: hypothetical protein VKM55_11785 [Candidatus Lokiarchaeia archaeon]|nr:hypothetical protein [Candidatus Lokiarchaeia archaeon]
MMTSDATIMTTLSKQTWRVSSKFLAETRFQQPKYATAAWKMLVIFTAIASLAMVLPALLPREILFYYVIETMLVLLESIAFQVRLRDGTAFIFLKGLPVPRYFLKRVITLTIARNTILTTIMFPVMVTIGALEVGYTGWIVMACALPGMIIFALDLPLAIVLAEGMISLSRSKARRFLETRELHDKTIKIPVRNPIMTILLKLASSAFKDLKFLAYTIAPIALAVIIILIVFPSPLNDDYTVYYMLVVLHGFLCFFIITGFSMAGARIALLTQSLPFHSRYLVRAKQILTTICMFVISAISITIAVPGTRDIGNFVVLSFSLFPIDMFYCWIIVAVQEFISSQVTTGRLCFFCFLIMNVTGSFFWFLTLIGSEASWMTFFLVLVQCLAWIIILEALLFKKLVS